MRNFQDKLEASTKIKNQKNGKEIRTLLGAIQTLSNEIVNSSEQTEIFRKLL